jgi:iron(III) transport system permease protein
MLTFYRRVIARGSFATITGKAFRPRPMDMGRMAWVLFSVCLLYVLLAVVLPIAALVFTSLQRFATVILSQAEFTLANYQTALSLGPVRTAMGNSLMLGFGVASVGVLVMVILVWIIYRSQLVGRGAVEYLVMFPQAVPRSRASCCRSTRAWRNAPASAAPAGSTRCARSPCRCSSPACWRPGC